MEKNRDIPQERPQSLWTEEPARRLRLPDPVRTAAVRAVIIIALTLVQAMVAVLCTLGESWFAFPMVLSSIASTVAATWGVLDVWVTRQVWRQRNGVISAPSSSARTARRPRRPGPAVGRLSPPLTQLFARRSPARGPRSRSRPPPRAACPGTPGAGAGPRSPPPADPTERAKLTAHKRCAGACRPL